MTLIYVNCTTKGAAGKKGRRERGVMFYRKFLRQLPHKPYCTDDLAAGLRIRPLEMALKYLYIQVNPPGARWALVFDVDHRTEWRTAQDAGLPTPTWQILNPDNGHSHIAYALKAPVCTSSAARTANLRYLAAIEAAYRQRLKADPLYTGLITKNPDRIDYWDVGYMDRLDGAAYTLDELAACALAELRANVKKERPLGDIAGLGRNCYIFEKVRLWAYTAVREYWQRLGEWHEAVEEHCQAVNAEFSTPLYYREVRCIARSIAGWTSRHFSPEKFSEFQRRNILLRWEDESRKADGLNLLRSGMSSSDVAEACGVSVRSVQRWRKEAQLKAPTLTLLTPWDVEGVSRATWYRHNAHRVSR